MSEFETKSISGYHFCFRPGLPALDFAHLASLLIQPEHSEYATLGGRASVHYIEVAGLGKIVIKSYSRGGVLGYLVRKLYLRLGPIRSQREFEILEQVRSCGVNAPEPLLYVYKGNLFYRTWLITREVEDKQTLVELALSDEDRARDTIHSLLEQIVKLIKNRIFHIDLHPGNVLVDKSGSTFLVDFDKAIRFKGPPDQLRDLYLFRWRRAVIKHGLPQFLSELVSLGLRSVDARPA